LESDYKKALYYQKKALSIAGKLGINYRIAEIHHHLAQIYNATKKYDLAISHIDSSLNLRIAIQENEGIGNSLVIKSEILLNQDKIDEALSIANESLNISKKFGLIHLIRDGNLILSKIYETNGSKDKALKSLKTYHLLKDSLLDIDKSKLIIRNELERKYELNELKNKTIQREKEFQLQKQKARTKNIIWIGIVLTLSFFVLVYLLYQKYLAQRKINNVVIENQKLNNRNII
jgi:tetratricopeptide (TPR) repeat protein